jgi:hypothetical protein
MTLDRQRTPLRFPLSLFPIGTSEPVETQTEEVGMDGFFCYTRRLFVPGELFEFALLLSAGAGIPITVQPCYMRGVAEVIHVTVESSGWAFGIDCRVSSYRVSSAADQSLAD